MNIERSVYVISDLHVGGSYPDPNAPHDKRKRGFRMMTHVPELAAFIRRLSQLPAAPSVELVINGDFIDFLAEEKGSGLAVDVNAPPTWTPFRAKRGEALGAFSEVVRRDRPLFDALREFLEAGKRLTLLLGNHDLELCLPDVRSAFEAELGHRAIRFLDDGQALDLGPVLIDHGNVFDPANVVDHDRLRVVRAAHSRGWFEDIEKAFAPPAGSKLVAQVMNPIKLQYGFIDLLKPESEPLLALLLALEPGYRKQIDEAAGALASAAKTLVPRKGMPFRLRNVGDRDGGSGSAALRDVAAGPLGAPTSPLDQLLADVLVEEPAAAAALRIQGVGQAGARDVAGGLRPKWSLLGLLLGEDDSDLESRIPLVQSTLRALTEDRAFERDTEDARYLSAAEWLATRGPKQKGYEVVVFGHTHHAKDVRIASAGARYFNTGTWANLMRFPRALTDKAATAEQVRSELLAFANRLAKNDLDSLLTFAPTYVRLDFGAAGRLITSELCEYDWKQDKL
jgi:UDP-2,3-diacylglucosamine pyrophosphatase LpxH